MTYPELQIQFDLNPDNRVGVLENANTCRWTGYYGYLFVDSENGQCYLFGIDGQEDDISKVKSFEYGAFACCKSLKSIKIPDSVKWIGSDAFWNCTSLKSIEIPDSVEWIESNAFHNCTVLTSIKIPSSIEWIGDWAFRDCKSLKEIVIKGKTIDEVKAMGSYPWGIEDESVIKVES